MKSIYEKFRDDLIEEGFSIDRANGLTGIRIRMDVGNFSRRCRKGDCYPSIRRINIHLTNYCDLKCPECCSLCHVAPDNTHMSMDEFNFLMDYSFHNKEWGEIVLYGGEPTFHPNFFDIIDILDEYRKKYLCCTVKICTNGYSDKTKEIISKIPDWVVIENSTFAGFSLKLKGHRSMTIAPIDLPEYKNDEFSKGCWTSPHCGRAYASDGFFPCSAAAHINRVMGLNLGIKDINTGCNGKMKDIMPSFCKFCGLYIYPFRYSNRNEISPTWEKAIKKYNER
jgi:hypothetical protein